MPHSGSLGRVLPLMKHRQSWSKCHTWTHESGQILSRMSTNKVTSHSAAKSWVVWHWPNVRHLHTLSQGDNTSFIQLFEVGYWAAILYQLADGSTVLKLGLDEDGILDGISRLSTYHGPPHWVPISCHGFYLSLCWEMA